MDLAGDEAVVRAEADIRAVNSSVQIVRTKRCEVDLDMVLNRYVLPVVSGMKIQTATRRRPPFTDKVTLCTVRSPFRCNP